MSGSVIGWWMRQGVERGAKTMQAIEAIRRVAPANEAEARDMRVMICEVIQQEAREEAELRASMGLHDRLDLGYPITYGFDWPIYKRVLDELRRLNALDKSRRILAAVLCVDGTLRTDISQDEMDVWLSEAERDGLLRDGDWTNDAIEVRRDMPEWRFVKPTQTRPAEGRTDGEA